MAPPAAGGGPGVGAVAAALDVLREDANLPCDISQARNAAVRLSCTLSTGGPAAAQELADLGGFCVLVAACGRHAANAELQRWLCSAIGHAAEAGSEAVADAAVAAGAVGAIVVAMSGHQASLEVQRWGLAALRSVLDASRRGAAVALTEAEGVDATFVAMAGHRESQMVQHAGLSVLGGAALWGEDAGDEGLALNGDQATVAVSLAVAAAAEHWEDREVVPAALSTLWALLEGPATDAAAARALLAGEGAENHEEGERLEFVVRCMTDHQDVPEVQRWGVSVLWALARAGGEQAAAALAAHGGVAAICDSLRGGVDNAELQERGLGALACIANSGIQAAAQSVIDEGGMQAADAAAAAHAENAEVRRWADATNEAVLDGMGGGDTTGDGLGDGNELAANLAAEEPPAAKTDSGGYPVPGIRACAPSEYANP